MTIIDECRHLKSSIDAKLDEIETTINCRHYNQTTDVNGMVFGDKQQQSFIHPSQTNQKWVAFGGM
jgi:hypothetical protein